MFFMQDELVKAIQQDRRREAEATRRSALPKVPRSSQPRLAFSAMVIAMRRTPALLRSKTS